MEGRPTNTVGAWRPELKTGGLLASTWSSSHRGGPEQPGGHRQRYGRGGDWWWGACVCEKERAGKQGAYRMECDGV